MKTLRHHTRHGRLALRCRLQGWFPGRGGLSVKHAGTCASCVCVSLTMLRVKLKGTPYIVVRRSPPTSLHVPVTSRLCLACVVYGFTFSGSALCKSKSTVRLFRETFGFRGDMRLYSTC